MRERARRSEEGEKWRERAPGKREKEDGDREIERCSRDEESRRKHPTGTIEGRGGEPRIEDEEQTISLSLSVRYEEREEPERRDEKLDLQICPDYYEIARLPEQRSSTRIYFSSRHKSVYIYIYISLFVPSSIFVAANAILRFPSPRCLDVALLSRNLPDVKRICLRCATRRGLGRDYPD